ncbi:ankyrin, partial [Parathielavia appendiculata]
MAVDPVTITTAIITLIDALQRAISLLDDFTNAERRVAVIRNDLVLTHSVLQYIRQQLASAREPPTLLIEGDGNPDATVNLRNILRDNVTQLQADVNALTDELEALGGPGRPETRIGRLIARGQVAWRMSYLERMDQSIVSKRMQLELVHNSLKCQTPDRRASDDDILVATFLRQFLPRRESNESLPVPDFEAQQNIARAVRDGNKAKLETLLQHVSPNCHVTVRGRELSPLHLATKRGDLAMVNFLITHGARIDCCGWDEDTPLTLAISHRHAVVALALIRRGANILLADRQERTPLHHAARENLYAVVQVLIHNGADLNAYDTAGRTPLMNAVRRSDREIQPYDTNVLRVLLRPNRQGTAADPALGT